MYVRQCGVSPLTLCVVESVGQLEWPLDTQNNYIMTQVGILMHVPVANGGLF